jgi:signal peptide peptidase SppA
MELAQEIFEARQRKPIIAVCNAMACSAAYWLASAASEVICTPSGQCGSIGVYMMHVDESDALEKHGIKVTIIKAGKYKAEGMRSEPLSTEAHDAFQGMVNDYYGMFVKGVARNRGVSQVSVREGYGQGRTLLANAAVKANLADRTSTLDEVLGGLGVGRPGMATAMRRDSNALRDRAELPDDDSYMQAIARRRRQLALAAGVKPDTNGIGEQMLALSHRRLALRSGNPGVKRGARGEAPMSAAEARRRLELMRR